MPEAKVAVVGRMKVEGGRMNFSSLFLHSSALTLMEVGLGS
jgi:hypothetical protein